MNSSNILHVIPFLSMKLQLSYSIFKFIFAESEESKDLLFLVNFLALFFFQNHETISNHKHSGFVHIIECTIRTSSVQAGLDDLVGPICIFSTMQCMGWPNYSSLLIGPKHSPHLVFWERELGEFGMGLPVLAVLWNIQAILSFKSFQS